MRLETKSYFIITACYFGVEHIERIVFLFFAEHQPYGSFLKGSGNIKVVFIFYVFDDNLVKSGQSLIEQLLPNRYLTFVTH